MSHQHISVHHKICAPMQCKSTMTRATRSYQQSKREKDFKSTTMSSTMPTNENHHDCTNTITRRNTTTRQPSTPAALLQWQTLYCPSSLSLFSTCSTSVMCNTCVNGPGQSITNKQNHMPVACTTAACSQGACIQHTSHFSSCVWLKVKRICDMADLR